jgi:Tfp pilus assembly protein FimT
MMRIGMGHETRRSLAARSKAARERSTHLRRALVRLNEKGSTIIEAVMTLGIAAIVTSFGALGLNVKFADLATSQQNLMNDLRKARTTAMRRGVHYRVAFADGSYRIERMMPSEEDAGLWEVDDLAEPDEIHLPSQLSVAVAGIAEDPAIEFDSRGMVVPLSEGSSGVTTVMLTDSNDSNRAAIEIWPSGQIQTKTETVVSS